MVIVAGYIDVDPAEREQFLIGRQEAIASALTEDGCQQYVFSADSSNPARVRLFEVWSSDEALNTHLAGMAQSAPDPNATARVGVELIRYQVASSGPLM